MTTPTPSFAYALDQLIEIATKHPTDTSRFNYLDSADLPHCLLGYAFVEQEVSPDILRGVNRSILPTAWAAIYGPSQFFGKDTDASIAEDYLVYSLYSHVQEAIDKRTPDNNFIVGLRSGLKSFLRFANSPTSGFLVQTRGAHPELLTAVNTRINNYLKGTHNG